MLSTTEINIYIIVLCEVFVSCLQDNLSSSQLKDPNAVTSQQEVEDIAKGLVFFSHFY